MLGFVFPVLTTSSPRSSRFPMWRRPGEEVDPGTVKESQFCREGAPKVLNNEWKKEALPYISPCFNTFVALFLLTQLTSPGPLRIDASTEPMNPSPELIKIIRVISNHY